jgi:endogenous inhibitor of DNA gyrase (YacG/DUF329 family)
MLDRKCKCCRKPFKARAVDVRRGWGRFCSKRCKAVEQEARTGQYASHLAGDQLSSEERQHAADMDGAEQGWDAHKNWGAGANA